MKKTQQIYLIVLVVFCVFLASCGSRATPLDGATKEAVLAYSEAKLMLCSKA
jgi:hypothetical protein